MAESELGVILPVGLSIAASAIFFAMTRFSKTSEGTLTGTIKIEHVQNDVKALKDEMHEGFVKLEAMINLRDDRNRSTIEQITRKIDDMEADKKLHNFRIELLEKEQKLPNQNQSQRDKNHNEQI